MEADVQHGLKNILKYQLPPSCTFPFCRGTPELGTDLPRSVPLLHQTLHGTHSMPFFQQVTILVVVKSTIHCTQNIWPLSSQAVSPTSAPGVLTSLNPPSHPLHVINALGPLPISELPKFYRNLENVCVEASALNLTSRALLLLCLKASAQTTTNALLHIPKHPAWVPCGPLHPAHDPIEELLGAGAETVCTHFF